MEWSRMKHSGMERNKKEWNATSETEKWVSPYPGIGLSKTDKKLIELHYRNALNIVYLSTISVY